ncbi:MAG: YggT family protein [Micrococcales bacterium]
MPLIGLGLNILLDTLFWLFMGRFVIDLLFSMNPNFKPRGLGLVVTEIVMTVTDWPMRRIRKFVKPIRIGGGYIDFSWTIALVIISVLQSVVSRFFF